MSHFATTTITEQPCSRCGRALLVALDEGLPVRVDAKPLPDRQAEIDALLDGKWTYTLTKYRQLWHRDSDRIKANNLDGTIHADHRCTGTVQLTLDNLIGIQ